MCRDPQTQLRGTHGTIIRLKGDVNGHVPYIRGSVVTVSGLIIKLRIFMHVLL